MAASNRGSSDIGLDRSRTPSPGALRPFHFPKVERRTLSNGIRLVHAPARELPVVTLSVILDAGAMRDEPSRLGLASLTASLLESGAGGRSAAQIAEEIEGLGVQLDTGAGWDTTQAGVTALASRLGPATAVLADLVRRPQFPLEEVERLRAERLAEILQRRAEPRALATEATARFIYHPESRVSRPLGGTESAVGALTRQDIEAFHAASFSPLSTSVVVVGDIDLDAAVELIETHFGDWAGGAPEHIEPSAAPENEEPQVVVVNRPGAVQSEIRVGHLGVARQTDEYFPIVVMNAILGGMFSSRLNLNLRERHGYTYGASSGFAMRRHSGSFVVSAAVQSEVTIAAVTEMLNELRGIRDAPVSDAELQDARNYFAGVFPLRLQTTDGIAGRLLEVLIYDLPDDHIDKYRDRVLAVSAEQVHQAATRHIRPDNATVVIVGDAESLRQPLEELGVGPVRVIEPNEIQESR